MSSPEKREYERPEIIAVHKSIQQMLEYAVCQHPSGAIESVVLSPKHYCYLLQDLGPPKKIASLFCVRVIVDKHIPESKIYFFNHAGDIVHVLEVVDDDA